MSQTHTNIISTNIIKRNVLVYFVVVLAILLLVVVLGISINTINNNDNINYTPTIMTSTTIRYNVDELSTNNNNELTTTNNNNDDDEDHKFINGDDPPFTNTPNVPRDEQYTTHFCINQESYTALFNPGSRHPNINWVKALCIFRNVIWQPDAQNRVDGGSFIYHQNPNRPIPWDFPWGTNLPKIDLPLHELEMVHFRRPVKVSDKPIPLNWKRFTDPSNDQQAVVIAKQDCSTIIGHSLGDTIWPVANAMLELRMWSLQNIILWAGNCTFEVDKPWKSKFWETIADKKNIKYLHEIGKNPSSQNDEKDNIKKTTGNNNNNYYSPVVLPLVVTGTGGRYLADSFAAGVMNSWSRDRTYRVMNFKPGSAKEHAYRMGRPRILLIEKSPGHRILNLPEVSNHLRKKFPRVQVDVIFPKDLSARDEIATAAETTILITPSGTTSFIASFMRDGSTAIFANLCWRADKAYNAPSATQSYVADKNGNHVYCGRLENHIWTRLPHLYKFYIGPKTRSVEEIIYDVPNPKLIENLQKKVLFRLYSYNISVEMIEIYVNEALFNAGLSEFGLAKHRKGFVSEEGFLPAEISYSG
jgi:hypothetical protein